MTARETFKMVRLPSFPRVLTITYTTYNTNNSSNTYSLIPDLFNLN